MSETPIPQAMLAYIGGKPVLPLGWLKVQMKEQ
jgi:hypothetical protein